MKKLLVAIGCLGLIMSAQALLGQGKGKGKGGAGSAQAGKEFFDANCNVCHNADSEERKMGPGLKGLFMHEKLANGEALTEASVRAFIDSGGNGMPPFGDLMTAADRDNLIAYLRSL